MAGVLIVAAAADAAFAEEVRGQARGLAIEIAPALPAGETRTVLLVWSEARPLGAADAPALVELWSQSRLLIARRDATPLPLGLGDLDSLAPGAAAREAALRLLHAALAPDRPSMEVPVPAPVAASAPPPAARARRGRLGLWLAGATMLALLMLGSMAFLGEHVGQTFESPPTSTPPGLPDGRTAEELDRSIAEAAARLNRSLANKRAVDDEDKEEIARLFRERERLRDQREAASASPPPAAGPTIEEIDRSLAEVERRLRQALAARRNSAEEDMHLRLRRELDELQLRREAALEAEKAEARRRTEALERQLAEQRQMLIAVVTGAAIVVVLGLAMFWLRQRTRAAIADDAPPRMAASAEPPPEVLVGEMLFVSYAHRDFARVDPIVSEIEALGKAVWIDRRGMVGGPGWAGQITRAIKGSRAVLLMASPSAYASDQVVRELYLAMGAKKAIVPIEIEPASMPDELEYILAGRQRHAVSAGDAREVLARALDRL